MDIAQNKVAYGKASYNCWNKEALSLAGMTDPEPSDTCGQP